MACPALGDTWQVSSDREVQSADLPPVRQDRPWHVFLSHAWEDGQYQTHALYDNLCDMLPGLRCFLDIKHLTSPSELEACVRRSRVFLLFLSPTYLERKNCMRELLTAIEKGMPMVVVMDIDKDRAERSLRTFLQWTQGEEWANLLTAWQLAGTSGRATVEQAKSRLRELLEGELDPERGPIPYTSISRANDDIKSATLRLIGQQVFRPLDPSHPISLGDMWHMVTRGRSFAPSTRRQPAVV